MSVLNVVTYGNPVLREKAQEVKEITPEILKIVEDMTETLSKEGGVGLAAPQVGISKRIFIADLSKSGIKKKVVLLNPKIIYKDPIKVESEEGCLSFPNVWGNVKRSIKVNIKGKLLNGQIVIIEGEDFFARVLQHELDHLDGKVFIDYFSKDDMEKNKDTLSAIVSANEKILPQIKL